MERKVSQAKLDIEIDEMRREDGRMGLEDRATR